MTTNAKNHYEDLLAERYAWMLGELEPRMASEGALLRRLGLLEGDGEWAVDLGCGTGLHSRVLVQMGYRVRAVDHSPTILEQLSGLDGVETEEADITRIELRDEAVVACMGDTLPHLPDWDAVVRVLDLWSPGRMLVLSFRDLTDRLEGTDRFFVVRQDDERIQTCFLEDAGEQVRVHDLFHEREDDGWVLRSSAYLKLRIDPRAVVGHLEARGARVEREKARGLITLLAR